MIVKSLSVSLILASLGAFMTMNRPGNVVPTSVPNVPVYSRLPVYLGAWAGGFWDSKSKTLNTDALNQFETAIDKKLAIANMFSEWGYLANPELLTKLNSITDNGWVPMISSNPQFFAKCSSDTASLYKAIADGTCDTFLKEVALNLKSYQKPILLRFAWEMNLPNMYWSVDRVGSTPEDFIGAWRRFYTVLKNNNADNVIWVLSFNTTSSTTIPYAKLYPGDQYVDWVAIDGYNWGDTQDWSKWTSFNGVFRNSYNELTAITDKPVMLSEFNSVSSGGDKAEWLKDALTIQIPDKYPNVRAIIFFNESKLEGEGVDWRIEISPAATQIVKDSLKNPLYLENFP